MPRPARIMLISGSLRHRSTNSALLRTVHEHAPASVRTVIDDALGLLPHFDPDHDRYPLPTAVERLRGAVRAADALLFCTPDYAGALPGSFKNLLDWTIGDDQPGSIYGKPVAWINTSTSLGRAADAHASLRTVLEYATAQVIDAACVHVPVTRDSVDGDGLVRDPGTVRAVEALRTLADEATRPTG